MNWYLTWFTLEQQRHPGNKDFIISYSSRINIMQTFIEVYMGVENTRDIEPQIIWKILKSKLLNKWSEFLFTQTLHHVTQGQSFKWNTASLDLEFLFA